MPDDIDHAELARLLADPSTWTEEDGATARQLLRHQRAQLSSVHPRDSRRRAGVRRVVDQLEAAVALADRT